MYPAPAHFLDGHRLSSLYRAAILRQNRQQVNLENTDISLFKYSAGVRGAKPPVDTTLL